MTTTSSSSSGVGFFGLLTIVFVTLKLLGKISWSWWLVLSPVLAGIALTVLLLLVSTAIVLFTRRNAERERKLNELAANARKLTGGER